MSYALDVWRSPGTKGGYAGGIFGYVGSAIFITGNFSILDFVALLSIITVMVLGLYTAVNRQTKKRAIAAERASAMLAAQYKGTHQQKAEKIIRGVEFSDSRQALATKIIARIREAEANGGVTKDNNPEAYALVKKRLGILKAMVKAQKVEDDQHRVTTVNDDDLIQAEVMGITPEHVEDDSPKAPGGVAADRVVVSDPDAAFHKAVSEQNAIARQDYRLCERCGVSLYSNEVCFCPTPIKTIENVQTQEQVDRRNRRLEVIQSGGAVTLDMENYNRLLKMYELKVDLPRSAKKSLDSDLGLD